MSDLTIYHNPRCSKSRQTLELIRGSGIEPNIVLYLEDTPSVSDLKDALDKLELNPVEILRKGEVEYKEHVAGKSGYSDDDLINLMVRFPRMIERPIVISKDKAIIGRPPENVLQII